MCVVIFKCFLINALSKVLGFICPEAIGSPRKHKTWNWKTTWQLLIDILEILKGFKLKLNMRKNSVMLILFYKIFKPRPSSFVS